MKKPSLIGITCAGIAATGLVFAAGLSGNATPKMNYAGAEMKTIIYSKTANAWPGTTEEYDATQLSSGSFSGNSVVKTTISSSGLMCYVGSASNGFLDGEQTGGDGLGIFTFSAGLTSLRSVTAVLDGSNGATIAYNTYASKSDVSTPIDQGTLSSGVTTTFAHTTGNYIGITFSRSDKGNVRVTTLTLTWNC